VPSTRRDRRRSLDDRLGRLERVRRRRRRRISEPNEVILAGPPDPPRRHARGVRRLRDPSSDHCAAASAAHTATNAAIKSASPPASPRGDLLEAMIPPQSGDVNDKTPGLLGEDGADQADDRGAVGEDADDVGAPADLLC
jgi:hypothetical protein